MDWQPIQANRQAAIDWLSLLHRGIDPYLVWGAVSEFKGVPSEVVTASHADLRLQLAVEWNPEQEPPKVDLRPIVQDDDCAYATTEVGLGEIAALLDSSSVRRIELGLARRARAAPGEPVEKTEPPDQLQGSVVAVIDFGCAFVHERFRRYDAGREEWRTRIAYLWDQNPAQSQVAPWIAVHGERYGRELTAGAIDTLMKRCSVDGRIDEDACYRAASYSDVDVALTHGTHVLDLAAGLDPTAPTGETTSEPPHIVFVQLPEYAVADTSGGSMVTHVLDALHYILGRVEAHTPLVVNLSYGSMAGPHDGSTLLERALDALIAREQKHRDFAIVLPAGNNFESDAHACVHVGGGAAEAALYWQVMADDPTDTFLEIWYRREHAGRLSLSVTPPGGPRRMLGIDEGYELRETAYGDPIAMAIHARQVAGGLNDAMALVALAPTHAAALPRAEAPAGLWKIELAPVGKLPRPVEVHLWIERDDPPLGAGTSRRQSRFLADESAGDGLPAAIVRKEMTGNSIANGARTVVVGACLGDGSKVASYSSAGPPRDWLRKGPWPDVVAPSDDCESLPGIAAAGTRSGLTVRMNGTSVAAPQVARWLIRDFAKRPGAGGGLYAQSDPLPSIFARAGRGRLRPF